MRTLYAIIMNDQPISEYYTKAELAVSFSAISHPNWRHFRIVKNGIFSKVERPLRDFTSFKDMLKKESPSDVYYSVSRFLEPHRLGPRTETGKHNTIFLGSDIVFDVDRSPLSLHNIDIARKETIALLEMMQREPKYIAFSGSKGFHVVYEDNCPSSNPDPYKREMETIEKRKALVKQVEDSGIRIDSPITIDTRRILRVPGTINSKTGMVCTILRKSDLNRDASHLLSIVPKAWPTKIKRYNILGHIRPNREPRQMRTYYSTYMSNAVLGTKGRYIPIITLRMNEESALRRFREIVDYEKLPQLVIFRTRDGLTAVSFRTFQKNELINLLKRCGSGNMTEFHRYKQNFLELDMTEPGYEPRRKRPVQVIKGSHDCFESRGHHALFAYLGLENPRHIHGSDEVKLSYAIETA